MRKRPSQRTTDSPGVSPLVAENQRIAEKLRVAADCHRDHGKSKCVPTWKILGGLIPGSLARISYVASAINMTRPIAILCFAVFALTLLSVSAGEPKQRADWDTSFKSANAEGTIVVVDERTGGDGVTVFNGTRAGQRFSPASTFKIPHALFALDAGLVTDEFQTFAWDGEKRWIEAWNRDQDLRSSMRNSVLWVYDGFARKLGEEGERTYLKKINYGNCDPTGTPPFWVEGNLGISAHEQIEFLRGLYRNALPFRVEHQRLVKDVIVVEAGRSWILRAKTGWSGTVGWWVGWVEWPTGPVFFALNIDTPHRLDDLPKREAVARAILQSMGALPKK